MPQFKDSQHERLLTDLWASDNMSHQACVGASPILHRLKHERNELLTKPASL